MIKLLESILDFAFDNSYWIVIFYLIPYERVFRTDRMIDLSNYRIGKTNWLIYERVAKLLEPKPAYLPDQIRTLDAHRKSGKLSNEEFELEKQKLIKKFLEN